MPDLIGRILAGQLAVGDAARASKGLRDVVARVATAAAELAGARTAAYWKISGVEAQAVGRAPAMPAGAPEEALALAARLHSTDWVIHRAASDRPGDQVLAVVWRAGGSRIGIACAYGSRAAGGFTEEDALLLQVISNSCGNVVQREEMVGRLQRTSADLHASETRFAQVLDISRRLNAVGEPDQLLQSLTERAMELVGAEAGFAGRHRPEGLVTHRVHRRAGSEPFDVCWRPGDGIPGWCLLSKGAYATNDLEHDSRTDEPLRRLGARQILGAAIVDAQDEVLGFIALLDKPGGFDAGDRKVVISLANDAAMALRNAMAYQRLGELERFKSDILNLAAHELRGPIAIARGYLEMLADDPDRWDHAQRESMLRVTNQKLEQMRYLVDQMLATARLDQRPPSLDLQDLDIREVTHLAAQDVAHALQPGHRLILDLGSSRVGVRIDPNRIRTAVTNLIENACKYSPDGGPIRVRIAVAGTPPWAELEVEDHGLGIADADLPRLFTRFGRIVTRQNSHIPGTGLGLYLSRQLARMHGGDITVLSDPERGTRFCLRLPLAASAAVDTQIAD